MQKAAIYARYSTDEQRATSIEDQVRRTTEFAQNLGYEVVNELVFQDSAVTGTAKGIAKRTGYARLCESWEKREFSALFVDEVSRLARDVLELARLQDKIERSGVRVVSTDGLLDTSSPGWQLAFGMSSVIAAHAVRETRHRVVRGMLGQLERGFMIAAPPFGYRLIRENDKGTVWEIDEVNAKWVREMYSMRRKGFSLAGIAEHLNRHEVPTPRAPRTESIRYWRPATVRQILANTIYRGVFILNGSAFTRAKAAREGKTPVSREFSRESLRLVEDEAWNCCNANAVKRTLRSGGRHWAAGLVSCGVCGAILTVATGGCVPSLYCAQCAQARRVGLSDRKGAYVSVRGLQEILTHCLKTVLTGDALEEFRRRLRSRLENGQEQHAEEIRLRIEHLKHAGERFLRLLRTLGGDSAQVEQQYCEIDEERKRCEAELHRVEAGLTSIDRRTIEKQLSVNPSDLMPRLFDGSMPAEQVRAALSRAFTRIVLQGKPARCTADFAITLHPGAAVATLSDSSIQENREVTLIIRLKTGNKRPTEWTVTEIQDG